MLGCFKFRVFISNLMLNSQTNFHFGLPSGSYFEKLAEIIYFKNLLKSLENIEKVW